MDPNDRFLGRSRELAVLHELADSDRPELFVLYGRRRVGKTELLQRLCRERRAVYFLAAQVRDRDNLKAFRRTLAAALDEPLLERIEFPDWSAALDLAADRAGDERLVVVLDEFPYLCESNKGLPSLIQKFWDENGKRSKLMLVLCGSQVSFMEKEVLAEKSPLFGRRTGQRKLEPIRPADALSFFPDWSAHDRLLAYAVLGGMPAYLQRFDPGLSWKENVLREILRPEGFLFSEVQFLLRSELKNPATYNSILGAAAAGGERVGDIALAVGVDSTTANKYLHVLRELNLVERSVPLTDPDPLRSRRGTYRIADRFLAFHFRHVQPHLSLIEAGRGKQVLDRFILPDAKRLRSEAIGDLVIDHLRREAAELTEDEIVEAGHHPGRAVMALARMGDGRFVAAAVADRKGAGTVGSELEQELQDLRQILGEDLTVLIYETTEDCEAPLAVSRMKGTSGVAPSRKGMAVTPTPRPT